MIINLLLFIDIKLDTIEYLRKEPLMKKLKTSVLIFLSIFAISCGQTTNNGAVGGAGSPAAAYCTQNSGKFEIRTDAKGNQSGFCLFDKNGKKSECGDFSFFRGECKPQD